ncbi:hypothetical protein pb186bvf_018097 [Paramecium bursaria]
MLYQNLILCTFQTLIGYICLDICQTMTLHFISMQDGKIEVAAISLGYNCIQILILPIGFGFNSAQQMMVSYALGSKRSQLAKTYLTINMYILMVVLIAISLLLYIAKWPISYLIQEDVDLVSDQTWIYLKYALIANFLALQFEGLKTYTIANQINYPFPIVHTLSTGAHFGFCYLFIVYLNQGVQGAGIAIILTESLNIILFILIILITDLKRSIFHKISLTWSYKRHWRLTKDYIFTSILFVCHIFIDFLAFFALSFFALYLGTSDMNAYQFITNTQSLIFKFAISLSIALQTFVGTEMGNGNIKQAKSYFVAGSIIYIIFCSFIALLFYFIGMDAWIGIYTKDEQVTEILKEVYFLMLLNILTVDGMQGALGGALKGINLIKFVLISTLTSYYIILFPLTYYMAFVLEKHQLGIQLAFFYSNIIIVVMDIGALLLVDWKKQSNIIIGQTNLQEQLRSFNYYEIEIEQQN